MDQSFFSRTNACVGIAPADCDELSRAATMAIDARGIVLRFAETLGEGLSTAGAQAAKLLKDRFDVDVSSRVEDITHQLMWSFQSGAMTGLDKDGKGDRWAWMHKAVVLASGASGGFFGMPGLLWDLPITTAMIMRSVADIARSFPGEDLASDDTKRACIEVFASGSPLAEDDEADLGYWVARSAIRHATIEATIRVVAARFGAVLSEKLLAQSVPILGAAAGAGLNYVFIDYYQEMARVQFMIRGVERRAPDPSAVRPCFSAIARQIQAARRVRGATAAPV